jgi:hypothetical protein
VKDVNAKETVARQILRPRELPKPVSYQQAWPEAADAVL